LKYGNRTVYRNTEIKILIYILSIPFLSEIFSAGFSCGKVPERNGMILSILVYTFFTRMFDFMLPLVVKYSIVAA